MNLYNNTDSDILVGTNDGSAGWALAAADTVTRFTIPNGVLLPARSFYRATNNGERLQSRQLPGRERHGRQRKASSGRPTSPSSGTAPASRCSVQHGLEPRPIGWMRRATRRPIRCITKGPGSRRRRGAEATCSMRSFGMQIAGGPKDTDDNQSDFISLDERSDRTRVSIWAIRVHSMASRMTQSDHGDCDPATPSTVRCINRPFTWNIPCGGSLSFPDWRPVGAEAVYQQHRTGRHATARAHRRYDDVPVESRVADIRAIDATVHGDRQYRATIVAGPQADAGGVTIQPNGGGLNATLMLDTTSCPAATWALVRPSTSTYCSVSCRPAASASSS